jgi:hypothetical protein
MKNDLFRYLKQSGIFKDNGRYEWNGGGRILASERTELKRAEKNKLNGIPYSKKEWDNIQQKLAQRKIEPRRGNIRNISEVNN